MVTRSVGIDAAGSGIGAAAADLNLDEQMANVAPTFGPKDKQLTARACYGTVSQANRNMMTMAKYSLLLPLIAPLVAATAPALAQETSQFMKCAEIAAPSERLACYDAAAGVLMSAEKQAMDGKSTASQPATAGDISVSAAAPSTAAPSTAATGRTASAAPLSEERAIKAFGSESLPEARKARKQLPSFTAKVSDIKVNPYGRITVTLENGQVWRQLSSDSKKVRIPRKGGDFTATVKRARLGSYFLRIDELNKSVRAERIK